MSKTHLTCLSAWESSGSYQTCLLFLTSALGVCLLCLQPPANPSHNLMTKNRYRNPERKRSGFCAIIARVAPFVLRSFEMSHAFASLQHQSNPPNQGERETFWDFLGFFFGFWDVFDPICIHAAAAVPSWRFLLLARKEKHKGWGVDTYWCKIERKMRNIYTCFFFGGKGSLLILVVLFYATRGFINLCTAKKLKEKKRLVWTTSRQRM